MDLKEIKKLMDLVSANELAEFELEEPDFRISIKRTSSGSMVYGPMNQAPVMMPPAHSVAAPGAASAAAEPAKDEDAGLVAITSPIVGTFYRSPSPEAPAFVKVGDRVEEDTVVCIVEAMKVMNEIKAECKGVIKKMMVENATPVEYGQALFKIDPVA